MYLYVREREKERIKVRRNTLWSLSRQSQGERSLSISLFSSSSPLLTPSPPFHQLFLPLNLFMWLWSQAISKLVYSKEKNIFIYLPPYNQIISLSESIGTETVTLTQRKFLPGSEREQSRRFRLEILA